MKKIFLIMFCMVLLVGTISALEFDNVKNYDDVTKTITIENAFGLGEDIATIKLNTPLNYKVPRGYQKVAEFELSSYTDYQEAFKELELYNVKDSMKEITRDYDYKYKTIEQISVDDYKESCKETWSEINKTNSIICSPIIIGSHLEDKVVWNNLEDVNFLKDEVLTIGIFTDVYAGDKVEWIPTFFGIEIDEWAVWEESLNVDLVAYYKLDESTGAVIDAIGNFDGTTNADRGGAGIINDSFSHVSANSDWTNLTTLGTLGSNMGSGMSVSLWIKTTEADLASGYLLSMASVGKVQILIILNAQTSSAGDLNKIFFQVIDAGGTTTFGGTTNDQAEWRDGGWAHLVFTYDGNNGMAIFVDGTSVPFTYTNQNSPSSWSDSDVPFGLAVRSDGTPTSNFADIELDEVGIWNRNLTASEVTDLYNGGSGITYIDKFNTAPNQPTLNAPSDDATNQILNPLLNVTITDPDGDAMNATFYNNLDHSVICTNNTNIANGTNVLCTWTGLSESTDYQWYVNVTDGTLTNTSDVWNFSTGDFTAPILTPPANATLEYLVDDLGVDFNADEEIDTWVVDDSTNFSINSTGYLINDTILELGTYVINVSANDTFGNTGWIEYQVNINDTINPLFDTIPANASIVYPTNWVGVFFIASDNVGIDNFTINDSRFTINSTGFLDADILTVGNYYLNITVNDTSNNLNSTIYNLNVTQSTSSCNVLFNETSPLTYPETFLAWSNCTSAFTLYVNGSVIANNSVQSLGAGSYNFSVVRTDQVNYSNTFDDEIFDIDKASPSGSLSGTSLITYGTFGDVEGTESNSGDGGCLYKLYREDFEVSNPDTDVLGVGVHNYIYNTTGCTNYSEDASLDTFALTINQNTENCDVLFNDVSPITYGDTLRVYSNCNSTFTLYRNGTIIVNNSVQDIAVNTYNFSVVRTDQVNYSNTFDDEFFTITIATGGGYLYLNGSVDNMTINRTEYINITAILVNGSGNNYLYMNDTLINSGTSPLINITQFNTTGSYIINYTYLGNENYTSFEKDLFITVIANPLSTVNIIYPTSGIFVTQRISLNFSQTFAVLCWYDLNEGGGSISTNCNLNITGITSQDDSNTWTIITQNIDGINTTTSVTFTIDLPIDYSDTTLSIVNLLKIFIMLSGLIILAFTLRSFYYGEITFGRLFRIGIIVGFAELFILLLAPIAINYISTLIN